MKKKLNKLATYLIYLSIIAALLIIFISANIYIAKLFWPVQIILFPLLWGLGIMLVASVIEVIKEDKNRWIH